MLPRFHAPALDPSRDEVVLPPDESHHLARVLRLGTGAEVAVFDGRGREFRARVVEPARGAARLAVGDPIEPPAESSIRLTLVQAILKGDSMDDVVRDATVLGVTTIVPIVTAHVAVSPRAVASGKGVERWRRVALAATKQCRRATLPTVLDPQPFDMWLASDAKGLRLLLVEPSASDRARPIRAFLQEPVPSSLSLIVGPEGGWASAEIALAMSSGCVPVRLGALTLRAEAAPIVALSMCRVVFDL